MKGVANNDPNIRRQEETHGQAHIGEKENLGPCKKCLKIFPRGIFEEGGDAGGGVVSGTPSPGAESFEP